jgi:hypothetical protein
LLYDIDYTTVRRHERTRKIKPPMKSDPRSDPEPVHVLGGGLAGSEAV